MLSPKPVMHMPLLSIRDFEKEEGDFIFSFIPFSFFQAQGMGGAGGGELEATGQVEVVPI